MALTGRKWGKWEESKGRGIKDERVGGIYLNGEYIPIVLSFTFGLSLAAFQNPRVHVQHAF